MLPSPSLGPPLLSASWSPPLFCGMPAVELAAVEPPELALDDGADEADVDGEADDADVEGEVLPLDPPPQPAAAIAPVASTATAAAINRDLRMVLPISRATHQR